MTARITENREVAKFRAIATKFCNLVCHPESVDIAKFLAELEILLPLLCSSVQFLPNIELSSDYHGEWLHKTWQQLFVKLRDYLGKYDSYCHVYEPYNTKDNEPTIGSLADDLADICRDLSPGLNAWSCAEADKRRAIVDDWQISYRIHWGYHAISAFWAIYWLIHHHSVGTEDETFEGHRKKGRKRKT
jgi:hypothetical protein